MFRMLTLYWSPAENRENDRRKMTVRKTEGHAPEASRVRLAQAEPDKLDVFVKIDPEKNAQDRQQVYFEEKAKGHFH